MTDSKAIETDVVVIGYGGAGATAAITAYDNGADVTILEKALTGGGNTVLSTGILSIPTGPEAIKWVQALCFGTVPEDLLETYVAGCTKIPEWVKQMGGESRTFQPLDVVYPPRFPAWANFPGAKHWEMQRVIGRPEDRGGAILWKLLTSNVERRKIRVFTNTSVRELIVNPNGEVTGVLAKRDEEIITIKARKGVILTCGGFENNDSMKETYLPFTPLLLSSYSGNTGDGIKMAQKIGASLWHMSSFSGGYVFKAKEYESGFGVYFHDPSFIFVDKGGRRYTDETGWEGHNRWREYMVFLHHTSNYPQLPHHIIFDETNRRKGPISGWILTLANDYKWSLDNSKEIARGWIKQGKTIEELASRIQVDEKVLSNTINKYNECCRLGRDDQWNRAKEYLEPINNPPYYAVEIWPTCTVTSGGPRRNKYAQVINTEGKPIPKLYVAGELGSICGFLTWAGSNLTDAIIFGQIAGRNAAVEKSL